VISYHVLHLRHLYWMFPFRNLPRNALVILNAWPQFGHSLISHHPFLYAKSSALYCFGAISFA
jgi:hypothetical protein